MHVFFCFELKRAKLNLFTVGHYERCSSHPEPFFLRSKKHSSVNLIEVCLLRWKITTLIKGVFFCLDLFLLAACISWSLLCLSLKWYNKKTKFQEKL